MNEEEKKQEVQAQASGQPTETPKTENVIDKATAAAERLEKATVAQRVENDRKEALMAREALGGHSNAGTVQVQRTPEEARVQDAANFFKGTELESAIRNG